MPLVDERTRRQLESIRRLLEPRENMRCAVFLAALVLGLGGIYEPLDRRIGAARAELGIVRRRAEMVRETDSLHRQVRLFEHRLHSTRDGDEWVQHILTGTRASGLRFRKYDPGAPRQIGPYEVLRFTFQFEGSEESLGKFVQWIEQSDRLYRIEAMRIEQLPEGVALRTTILALGTQDEELLRRAAGG